MILVCLHVPVNHPPKDVTMDLCGFHFVNAGRLCPATPNRFEVDPEHSAINTQLKVPMNSELILYVKALEEACQLLKADLGSCLPGLRCGSWDRHVLARQ